MTPPAQNTYQGMPMLGRYVLLREIARSNDVVWEANDTQMGRRVAVKELALPPTLSGQAKRERIERFYREARAAGAMSHANIVTIFEVGEDNGRYFIAMEYLEGQTLRDRLLVSGSLPLSEAVHVAGALCDALTYAHGRGVIHRDIKPDNVHLLPDGRIKLTDFGIARITHEDALTIDGQVFGTPSYMSPEQVVGRQIDTRSDIFSLGILLYEMLSGRKPFTGDSVVTITYRILHDEMPVLPGISPAMEAVLRRALAKDPNARFATAQELRNAVVAAAERGGFVPQAPLPVPGGVPAPAQATAAYTLPHAAPGALTHAGYPVVDADREYGSGRSFVAVALVVLLLTGLVLGGGWAVSRAYRNYQLEARVNRDRAAYHQAKSLYDAGEYERAARAFDRLRAAAVDPETRRQSLLGLLYCYRQLGGQAVRQNNLAAAERWFRAAVALVPDDPQARQELNDVLKARGAPPESAPPAPSAGRAATPSAAARPNGPSRPDASAGSFQAANNARASEAGRLLQAGDEAAARGNREEAGRFYAQAVQAGPGSPAALEAQKRLNALSAMTQPF